LLSLVRKFLYRIGLLSTYHFDVAVVVVGNITVGGSGKTPIVMALTIAKTTLTIYYHNLNCTPHGVMLQTIITNNNIWLILRD
jgi:hypothetical protein